MKNAPDSALIVFSGTVDKKHEQKLVSTMLWADTT